MWVNAKTLILRKIKKLTVLFCFGGAAALGQKSPVKHEHDLLWSTARVVSVFSADWQLRSDFSYRNFIMNGQRSQLITHQHLHRKLGNKDLALGYTFSNALAYEATYARSEHRAFLEGNYDLKIKKANLQQRLRIEERFFLDNLATETNEQEIRPRFRYRIMYAYGLGPSTRLLLYNELFLQTSSATRRVFDTNRLGLTLNQKIGSHLTLEAGYMYSLKSSRSTIYYANNLQLGLQYLLMKKQK